MEKFGHGEYEQLYRNETPASVEHTRNFFLQTVSNVAPEVLDDLGGKPSSLYQQTPALCYEADEKRREKSGVVERYIWSAYQRPAWMHIEIPWRDPLLDAPFTDELDDDHPVHSAIARKQLGRAIVDPTPADDGGSIAAFKVSLLEWSHEHNLNEMWCRERAYATLDLWCYSPGCRKARIWQEEPAYRPIMRVGYRGYRPNFDFVFKHEMFYPREGFRQQVKQRILKACEEQLNAFLDQREQAAREGKMVATQQRRVEEHFEWLVLRQVKKPYMTCKQIFELYQDQSKSQEMPRLVTTVRAVEKAVKELADFIGLTPRYAGRGRKPKTPAEPR